jgi:hypothetical protein
MPGSQVVRQRILIPPYAGSTPARATTSFAPIREALRVASAHNMYRCSNYLFFDIRSAMPLCCLNATV